MIVTSCSTELLYAANNERSSLPGSHLYIYLMFMISIDLDQGVAAVSVVATPGFHALIPHTTLSICSAVDRIQTRQ